MKSAFLSLLLLAPLAALHADEIIVRDAADQSATKDREDLLLDPSRVMTGRPTFAGDADAKPRVSTNTAESVFGSTTVIAAGQVPHNPGALARLVPPVQ